jgi:hypothetical protein
MDLMVGMALHLHRAQAVVVVVLGLVQPAVLAGLVKLLLLGMLSITTSNMPPLIVTAAYPNPVPAQVVWLLATVSGVRQPPCLLPVKD